MALDCQFKSEFKDEGITITSYVLGCILVFGVIISFVPQYYKIIKGKSTDGIDWFTLLLSTIAMNCAFISILFSEWIKLVCCDDRTSIQCIATLLPLIHLFLAW